MRTTLLAAAAVLATATAVQAGSCDTVASCRSLVAAASASTSNPFLSNLFAMLDDVAFAGMTPEVVDMVDAAAAAEVGSTDSQWCPNNSYFELVPVPVATVTATSGTQSWSNDGCFANLQASWSANATGYTVTLSGSNPTSLLCSDSYIIANSFDLQIVSIGQLNPTATAFFSNANSMEAFDMNLNGLKVMLLPCGLLGTIASAVKTAGLFSGNDSTLDSSNIDFLTERKVWPAADPFGKTVPIDKSALRSGDYLAIARLDGLDPMIMFGTGGTTGHSAVAVWNGSQLYVVESTDKDPFANAYWPPPYGIIVHEFDTWVSLAQQAGYHVGVLPIQPALADAFDEGAFWSWFASVQGMPYGYHSMLMSFLDTFDPYANLPQPINNDVATLVFNKLDALLPNSSMGVSVYSMLTWGLNIRLNASCTTLACIIDIVNHNKAAGKPIATLGEATAIPDQDSWKFGANYSMVCSELAAHVWKTGLGAAFPVWQSIQAAEQTPKDNYQMALFDPNRFTSTTCPGGLTQGPGGNGTYCQIMGEFVLYLNGYNTVPIYAHMNERCPAQWPNYVRCPAGNPTCC